MIQYRAKKFLELRYGDWKTPKPKSKDGYKSISGTCLIA